MIEPDSVSILGCGWLGLPLAKLLIDKNHLVKGSTRTKDKIRIINKNGIKPYILHVDHKGLQVDSEDFFNSNVLFINIPPGKKRINVQEVYPKEISQILNKAHQGSIRKIVFISSTSVYPNINGVVTEETLVSPTSPSSHALITAEELIKASGLDWTIIRMAGLVGPSRHPGKWFAGKSNLPNGLAPVNLIHLDDSIAIAYQAIIRESIFEIYNACADAHPIKSDFYSLQTSRLNLPSPSFIDEKISYKIISIKKIKSHFKYDFIHPDPMKFFENISL